MSNRTGFRIGPGSYEVKASTNKGISAVIRPSSIIHSDFEKDVEYVYVENCLVKQPKLSYRSQSYDKYKAPLPPKNKQLLNFEQSHVTQSERETPILKKNYQNNRSNSPSSRVPKHIQEKSFRLARSKITYCLNTESESINQSER